MRERKRNLFIGGIVVLLVIAVLALLFGKTIRTIIDDPRVLRTVAANNPVLAPFIIIGVIVLEVVIAPLPGGFIPVATGALFGAVPGTLYSWLGNVIGAALAWLLARTLGRPFAERLFGKKKLSFYDSFVVRHQHIVFLLYAIPLLPVDIVSFSIGLATIPLKRFLIFVALALLPNMLMLNLFGDSLFEARFIEAFWLIGTIIVLVLVTSFALERYGRKKR